MTSDPPKPSLGQLYSPQPPTFPSAQHDIAESLGAQFSEWIAVDTATREVAHGVEDATDIGTQWHTALPNRLSDEWYAGHSDSFATVDEVAQAASEAPETGPDLAQDAAPAEQDAPTRASSDDRRGLARASALMAAGTLVSRVLGLARGVLQVTAIGATTAAANAWSTANTLPNIIYLLLAGGVINAVLVPQITKALRHEDGGKGYTDRLLTLAFTILGVLTAVCVLAAPLLYRLYDLSASDSRLALGTSFALICLPQIFFYGVYALLGQVLNARGRFGAFMWAPALANVVAIAGLVYFLMAMPHEAPLEDWTASMVWVLAGSATLGIVLQALCLIPVLAKDGYRFTPNFRWRGVGLRSTSKIALWAFAAVVLQQLGLVITTNVLNTQAAGEPGKGAQEYAYLLFMLPHSLLTVSLVTALFTRMSKAANAQNHPLVRRDMREGLRLIGVATIPCAVGGIVLAVPLITMLYGAGSVWAIGSIMVPMLLGLTTYGLCVMVQRAFYAYEDAKTPFWMQVITSSLAAVITLSCLVLPDHYVGVGIGLSLTLSNTAQGIIGLRWLQRRTGRIMIGDVVRTYVRLLVASLIAAGFAFGIVALMRAAGADGKPGSVLVVLIAGPIFLLIYVWCARIMRVSEIEDLVRPVVRRLPGRGGR
ncbi:murein biosynthesis integral membrane protein MurJ [Demetria terragena]|uniref:murein biosynthesis integral membrane protein MurJ n=1 Tax=Demetria terragena TaxID=63959 RepID=UPI0012E99635|nr:murein biosynthesis integral membrane protein MurJ [Demetria terragena]